jgi:hypothetical protein
MASFFPVFVDGKYQTTSLDGEKVGVINPVLISFAISAFMMAQMLSSQFHTRTISLLGRKTAILVSLAILTFTNILLGMASLISSEYP